jgi:hypothetical protein
LRPQTGCREKIGKVKGNGSGFEHRLAIVNDERNLAVRMWIFRIGRTRAVAAANGNALDLIGLANFFEQPKRTKRA